MLASPLGALHASFAQPAQPQFQQPSTFRAHNLSCNICTRHMTVTQMHPVAMLRLGAASRLACSLRQRGNLLTNTFRGFTIAHWQHRQQQRAAAAAAAAAAAGRASPGPPQAAAQPPQPQEQASQHLTVLATSPTATQLLAHYFACELHPADCYLLFGSVGAGKSYFRCACGAQPALLALATP